MHMHGIGSVSLWNSDLITPSVLDFLWFCSLCYNRSKFNGMHMDVGLLAWRISFGLGP